MINGQKTASVLYFFYMILLRTMLLPFQVMSVSCLSLTLCMGFNFVDLWKGSVKKKSFDLLSIMHTTLFHLGYWSSSVLTFLITVPPAMAGLLQKQKTKTEVKYIQINLHLIQWQESSSKTIKVMLLNLRYNHWNKNMLI